MSYNLKLREVGTLTKLANSLGLSRQTISNIIEAIDFRSRTSSVPDEVATNVIAETRGLPDETRVKILKSSRERGSWGFEAMEKLPKGRTCASNCARSHSDSSPNIAYS